jgi:hypothetical protein
VSDLATIPAKSVASSHSKFTSLSSFVFTDVTIFFQNSKLSDIITVEFTGCTEATELIHAHFLSVILLTFTVFADKSIESISAICIFVVPGSTTIYVVTPDGNVKLGTVFKNIGPVPQTHC